jgi:putative FmdB family regulatory protein
MPLYDYSCKKCNRTWEASHKIEQRKDEYCCDLTADLVISATRTRPIILEGYNQGIGEYITGPKQKKQMMKKHNLEEA